jgi:hypothetical protein
MTSDEVENLARALALDLLDNDETIGKIVLLLNEIAVHPFDASHVEMVANFATRQLFAVTVECDRSETKFLARLRDESAKGGA